SFAYLAELNYNTKMFYAGLHLEVNGNQRHYSRVYGEGNTTRYAVLNLNLVTVFYKEDAKYVVKYGVENILDTSYSTYADWNNINRQGRNVFMNISIVLN